MRNKQTRYLFLSSYLLVVLLIGCVPVVRTEYISPNWLGQILLVNTVSDDTFTIKDLFSGNSQQVSLIANQLVAFNVPAASQGVSFKMPAASMARRFAIAFESDDFNVDLKVLKTTHTNPPHEVEIGTVIIDRDAYNKVKVLPASLQTVFTDTTSTCLHAMSSAMYFLQVKNRLESDYYAEYGVVKTMSERWRIEEQFYFVESECFRTNYEKRMAFKHIIKPYLNKSQGEE